MKKPRRRFCRFLRGHAGIFAAEKTRKRARANVVFYPPFIIHNRRLPK